MRIKALDKIIASSNSANSKVLKINKILERTFRYIIPFYEGIIAYQRKKNDLEAEAHSEGRILNSDDRKKIRELSEEAFFEAAKISRDKIIRDSLGKLEDAFKELNKKMMVKKESGKGSTISEEGKLLKNAIGRNYICSLNTFDRIIEFKKEEFDGLVIDNPPANITKYINYHFFI